MTGALTKDAHPLAQRIHDALSRKPDEASIVQGVRHLRRGRPHVRIVLFPSQKNGGHIPCDGRLEADAALCFELDPAIQVYRGQPFEMEGPNGRPIVPDFLLQRGHFHAVVDVKPHGQLMRQSVKERMQWARRQLAAIGIPHYIITEQDLNKQPMQQIRESLRLGQVISLRENQADLLIRSARDGPATVSELRKRATDLALSPFAVEKLALLGRLTFPLDARWRETTLLGVPKDESDRTTASGRGTVHDICLPL